MNIRLYLSPSAILTLLLLCFDLSPCQLQPPPDTCKEAAR